MGKNVQGEDGNDQGWVGQYGLMATQDEVNENFSGINKS
jgi:hypothetical protein